MIRRPPRSTLDRSSAASDVYKRQVLACGIHRVDPDGYTVVHFHGNGEVVADWQGVLDLSLIHISEPTRPY